MRNVFIDGDSVKISRRVAELAEDYGCELIVCSDLSHDESEKATITYRCDTGMDASDFKTQFETISGLSTYRFTSTTHAVRV